MRMTWAVTPAGDYETWRIAMDVHPGQVVCFETFRRERAGRRARVLPYLAPTQPSALRSPFREVELTDREVEHRQQMLRHLADGGGTAMSGERQ